MPKEIKTKETKVKKVAEAPAEKAVEGGTPPPAPQEKPTVIASVSDVESPWDVLVAEVEACVAGRAEAVFNREKEYVELRFTKIHTQQDGVIQRTPYNKQINLGGVKRKNIPALVERCINN